MYRVFIYDDMEHFSDADLEAACCRLPEARRRKAMSYVRSVDRKQSAIATLLLRHALRTVFAIDRLPDMRFESHGKPRLEGADMPEFNLSHCTRAVACAVADEPVGIDVEPFASYSEEVARAVFNDAELKQTLDAPEAFADLWTRKESYLKYTGEGLTDSLKTLLLNTGEAEFHSFHNLPGYACTVCARTINHANPTFVDKTALLNG